MISNSHSSSPMQQTRISLARFGALDLAVEAKPDLTPVTDADRAVEQALRDALASPGRMTRSWVKNSARPQTSAAADG